METLGTEAKGEVRKHLTQTGGFDLGLQGGGTYFGKQDRHERRGHAQGLKHMR